MLFSDNPVILAPVIFTYFGQNEQLRPLSLILYQNIPASTKGGHLTCNQLHISIPLFRRQGVDLSLKLN